MRILFQGDSITAAFRRPEEQNTAFQLGNGYAFLVAARLAAAFPNAGFEFINRGISGDGIDQLLARWETDAAALTPETLSLLVGVNETIRAMKGSPVRSPAQYAEIYRHLLKTLRDQNPHLRLILMEPFLVQAGKVDDDWIAHIAPFQLAVREIAGEFDALHIPLQSMFDDACLRAAPAFWAFDGVHPTHAGFELIAQAWVQVFQKTLTDQGAFPSPA